MRKVLSVIFIAVFISLLFFPLFALAKEISQMSEEEVKKDLEETKKLLEGQTYNEQEITKRLNGISERISSLGQEISKKEVEVKKGEEALSYQEELLKSRVYSYYKNSNKQALDLVTVLLSGNLSGSLRDFFYQKSIVDRDRDTITKVVLYIKNLEEIKAQLTQEKNNLASLKTEVDRQLRILQGEISKSRQRIAQLSARQKDLIDAKQRALNIPRSAGTSARGCTDDRNIDPGFSPRIAFFTFGAPHRNGLNQYGAFGRAKAGQNEEQILQEYYPNMSLKKDYDQGAQVNVDGHGTFSIEDYVKRVWEVPNSWGDEGGMAALKAQAVAARTYALNSMQRNGHICTTESCQVFRPEEKGGKWGEAVEATKGWVMMDGGSPGFTQYASTHGGFILNLGKFDGSGGHGSFGEIQANAYDRESPWFYCDWGARSQYSNTAWLRPSEVADIVNVILLARKNSSTGEHLYQTDKPHPDGGEVWDQDRVKRELGSESFNNVTDVSINADFNSGKTTSVNISGDGKSTSIGADEFKNWFNLRAPSNIQIVGPLYNVERR
ncbi:MAG: SpoIID/LytB domain-containing protein [Patescibacteria group bacterium]